MSIIKIDEECYDLPEGDTRRVVLNHLDMVYKGLKPRIKLRKLNGEERIFSTIEIQILMKNGRIDIR